VYYFEMTTKDQANEVACIHNGYILHRRHGDASNFLMQRYFCRKVCDEPDKFEQNHCTFEVNILKVTEEEGRVQNVKNYHTAHKDDLSFYTKVAYEANKDRHIIPVSEQAHRQLRAQMELASGKPMHPLAIKADRDRQILALRNEPENPEVQSQDC
jgi:hypothetical protein